MANEIAAQVLIVETNQTFTTPFNASLNPGAYTLKATYQGVTEQQSINVASGQTTPVSFTFSTGSVIFNGSVSKESAAGETITITVTRPDGSQRTATALTDASGNFTVTYTDLVASYTAVASIPRDSQYQAAQSQPITFSTTLLARTLTLSVG